MATVMMKERMDIVQRQYGSTHGYQFTRALSIPDDEYEPPTFPVELPKFIEKVKFGAEMKAKHFFLDGDWTYIDHGHFGAALREAIEAEVMWMKHTERQSVKFFGREFFPCLAYAIRRVAKFLDADREDIVFVRNATTGNSTVIRSVVATLKPGDSMIMLSVAYGTVKKFLQQISLDTKIRVDEVEVKFPIASQESLVKLVEDSIKPDTKFAVLDHVSSAEALTLPIKEMIEVCHKRGVQVLVDGSHCFGSLPLSMRDIGADYYVTNAHKWFLSPKGCSVLYVDKFRQQFIKPLVISWGHNLGFSPEFAWSGTDDYTQYLSLHTVLDFWEFYGPDKIRDYLYRTIREACQLLVKEWGTDLLADPSFFCSMALVRLPDNLIGPDGPEVEKGSHGQPHYDYKHAGYIGNKLQEDYKIEVSLKVNAGRLYVRISAHIYNELNEFQRLADAISDLKRKKA